VVRLRRKVCFARLIDRRGRRRISQNAGSVGTAKAANASAFSR
jgi:hypothetical protein